MRTLLLVAAFVALPAPALADVACTDLACVGVDEPNSIAYVDGAAPNPDPADGFVALYRSGSVCFDENGNPDDGVAANGPESDSPTCSPSPAPPPLPPPEVCYPYNPSALTNACVALEVGTIWASTPPASIPGRSLCVVGNQCVPIPGVSLPPMTVAVPVVSPEGYVEATVLCVTGAPCGVRLP